MPMRSSRGAAVRSKAKPLARRKDGTRRIRYSEALAREVCARIAQGEAWSRIGGTEGMPTYSTLHLWKRIRPGFAEALAEAQAAAASFWADEVLAVAQGATRDTILEDRLQVGSLKWRVNRADGLEARRTAWNLGDGHRLVITVREFERAYREDGTPYVREITPGRDADSKEAEAGE